MSDTTQQLLPPLDLDALKGFTPGPWTVETLGIANNITHYIGTTELDGGVGEIAATIADDEGYRVVARDKRKANARLIAVAPQLYAELVEARALAEHRQELVLKLCQEKLELHEVLTEARVRIADLEERVLDLTGGSPLGGAQ